MVEKLLWLVEYFLDLFIIVNVVGYIIEDYVRVCEVILMVFNVVVVEINIFCFNVKCGGIIFGINVIVVYDLM